MVNRVVDKGGAQSGTCPRAGVIALYTESNLHYWMPTKCATWRCRGCRDSVLGRFKYQVECGLLMERHCQFITFTLRLEYGDTVKDADYVAVVWRRFLRRWREIHPKMAWLRVIEITKKNQPHLHVAMTGLGPRKASCLGKLHPWPESWPFQTCRVDCLEHEIGRIWYECTGDSYVTQVTPIVGAAGAAAYLGKYISKIMYEFTVLERLGFGRRWGKSNNWPATKRVRLRGTVDEMWSKVSWTPGLIDDGTKKWLEERNSKAYLLERVGDHKSLLMEALLVKRRNKGRIKAIATQLLED